MVSALGQGAYDRLQSCLASTVRIAAEKNKLEARTHRYFENVRQAAGRAGVGVLVWPRLGGRRRQDAGAEVFQVYRERTQFFWADLHRIIGAQSCDRKSVV